MYGPPSKEKIRECLLLLGLQDATEITVGAVKSAYRKLAFSCHPDLHPGDAEKETAFKAIAEAYETLIKGHEADGRESVIYTASDWTEDETETLPEKASWGSPKRDVVYVYHYYNDPERRVFDLFLHRFASLVMTPETVEEVLEARIADAGELDAVLNAVLPVMEKMVFAQMEKWAHAAQSRNRAEMGELCEALKAELGKAVEAAEIDPARKEAVTAIVQAEIPSFVTEKFRDRSIGRVRDNDKTRSL